MLLFIHSSHRRGFAYETACLWDTIVYLCFYLFIYIWFIQFLKERKKKQTCCFGEIEGLARNVALSSKAKGSKMPTVAMKIQEDNILRGALKRFVCFFLCISSVSVKSGVSECKICRTNGRLWILWIKKKERKKKDCRHTLQNTNVWLC